MLLWPARLWTRACSEGESSLSSSLAKKRREKRRRALAGSKNAGLGVECACQLHGKQAIPKTFGLASCNDVCFNIGDPDVLSAS